MKIIMRLLEFLHIFADESATINELRQRYLLRTAMQCNCGVQMEEIKDRGTAGIIFRCTIRNCRKRRSIREGSFFSGSKLSLINQMILIYTFSHGWSEDLIMREFGYSRNTVVDWMRYCREICMTVVENDMSGMIGGPGLIVEIDETVIVRRKYDRGRMLRTQWMVGGIERNTDGLYGKCFVKFVDDRRANTLDLIIAHHVDVRSRLITDGWRGYSELRALGFEHDIVVHERNFIDTNDSDIHTQNIESF